MAIQAKDLFSISHYEYGEAYFGSYQGMRFRVAPEPLKNIHYAPVDKRGDIRLRASAWPEPDSYRSAPKDQIACRDFPFSQEGLEEAVRWLNEWHEENQNRWQG